MANKKPSQITVKAAHKKDVIAFGSSGKPLGERDDLVELLIAAHIAGDNFILRKFERPPSLKELQRQQAAKDIPASIPATENTDENVTP